MSHSLDLPFIRSLNSRTPEEKKYADEQHKVSHLILKALRNQEGNKHCGDCGARNPGWAALPHGVFLCIDCAQVHRGIGRHISQVKSMSTGTYIWYEDEIDAMRLMGNDRVNKIYLAEWKEEKLESRKEIEQHIKSKYVDHRWLGAIAETKSPSSDKQLYFKAHNIEPSQHDLLDEDEKERVMKCFQENEDFFQCFGL